MCLIGVVVYLEFKETIIHRGGSAKKSSPAALRKGVGSLFLMTSIIPNAHRGILKLSIIHRGLLFNENQNQKIKKMNRYLRSRAILVLTAGI